MKEHMQLEGVEDPTIRMRNICIFKTVTLQVKNLSRTSRIFQRFQEFSRIFQESFKVLFFNMYHTAPY